MTTLHRLRIGYTQVIHGNILKRENRPMCEHCNEPITVTHLICEFPSFTNIREYCSIRSTLKENLNGKLEIENTLEFCKGNNIYEMILYNA